MRGIALGRDWLAWRRARSMTAWLLVNERSVRLNLKQSVNQS